MHHLSNRKVGFLTQMEVRDDDAPDSVNVDQVNSPPGILRNRRVAACVVPPDGARVAVDSQRGNTCRRDVRTRTALIGWLIVRNVYQW